MWPFHSNCTVTVQASLSSRDSCRRCERYDSDSSPTFGTYIYPQRHASRHDERDCACRCDSKRHTHARELEYERRRRYDGDVPCRAPSSARSSGEGRRVVLQIVDRTSPCCSRHRQSCYSVYASVRTTTEEVIACLVTDSHAQEVRVHWRGGDSERLHRSVPILALANDAAYLEVRSRAPSCRCC